MLGLAVAPILIVVVYIYIRDKYEKEPLNLLFLGLFFGCCITAPILMVEQGLDAYALNIDSRIWGTFFSAFITASFTEETFKFIILYALVWHNKNYNERFDGIVYATFISLGFALVENIMYVIHPDLGGVETGLLRSLFAVPAHALFGITMGYYLSLSRYEKTQKLRYILKAFFIPIILHGIYDFILIYQSKYMLLFFVPYVLFLWVSGFRKMKKHINDSVFKPKEMNVNIKKDVN